MGQAIQVDFIYEVLLLVLVLLLLCFVSIPAGFKMASPADLQKLVDNMKRAQSVLGRAANDSQKHSAIMDSFEQRLNLNDENMSKIEEYEKLMASMDVGGNGGPAMEATFSSSLPAPEGSTSNSTKGIGKHGT